MSKDINYESDDLMEIMELLELETGVKVGVATAPAPVVSTVSAGPVEPVGLDELAELEASLGADAGDLSASVNGEISPEDLALHLAELSEPEPTPEPAPVVTLPEATDDDLEGLLAECEAMPATEATPVIETLVEETPISVDDELAALEAGLNEDLAAPALAPSMDAAIAGTSEALALGVIGDTKKEEFVELPPDSTAGKPYIAASMGEGIPTLQFADPTPQPGQIISKDSDSGLPAVVGMNFYVDPNQFKVDTRISDVELDHCMMEQNSLRAYYGSQAAYAEAQHARIKLKFEILEAKLYDEHRRILLEDGEKVTEKMVENRVKTDPKWFAGKSKVIDAQSIAEINRALVDSLRDRASMLIQLGADRRDEMKGQARTMAGRDADMNLAQRAILAAQGSK